MVPVDVVEQSINIVKHESFGMFGSPNISHEYVCAKLASGKLTMVRGRVAVKPKLPAVPVVALNVTELMALINLPATAETNGYKRPCLGVAPNAIAAKLPVLSSLYVTFTVAFTPVAPSAV